MKLLLPDLVLPEPTIHSLWLRPPFQELYLHPWIFHQSVQWFLLLFSFQVQLNNFSTMKEARSPWLDGTKENECQATFCRRLKFLGEFSVFYNCPHSLVSLVQDHSFPSYDLKKESTFRKHRFPSQLYPDSLHHSKIQNVMSPPCKTALNSARKNNVSLVKIYILSCVVYLYSAFYGKHLKWFEGRIV